MAEFVNINLPDDHPLCGVVAWAQARRDRASAALAALKFEAANAQEGVRNAESSLAAADATVRALHAAINAAAGGDPEAAT